jgi:ElaB/YqjD/DUF883 family membrane-anchored ribosome-binding protein
MPNATDPAETHEQASEHRDLGQILEGARDQLGDAADRARRVARRADRKLQEQMQENPLLVLGIAVGVGYVIGRIFSRYR